MQKGYFFALNGIFYCVDGCYARRRRLSFFVFAEHVYVEEGGLLAQVDFLVEVVALANYCEWTLPVHREFLELTWKENEDAISRFKLL